MATPTPARFNSKSPTIKRILREAQELATSPSPDFLASPLDHDLFEWHFTLRGPPHSPYALGFYHGRIILPPTYPLRPPSFRFSTPSGRFEPNREICLSISGHHEETWQPAWGVRTALVGLRALMVAEPQGQVGGMVMPDEARRRMAEESRAWRCVGCGGRTNEEAIREAVEAAAVVAEGASEQQEAVAKASSSASAMSSSLPPPPFTSASTSSPARQIQHQPPTVQGAQDKTAESDFDSECAELAEAFVPTTTPPASSPPAPATALAPAPASPTNGPSSSSDPTPPSTAAHSTQRASRQPAGETAMPVPLWLDRLIVLVGMALVSMILKVFLFKDVRLL